MGRVLGGGIILLMTGVAVCRPSRETIPGVALRAAEIAVCAREGKTGRRVVEVRSPADGVDLVAGDAVGSESRLRMGGGQCRFEIDPMAGIAVGRNPGVFVPLLVGVARPACRGPVPPHKRETGL